MSLKAYVDEIEALDEQIADLNADKSKAYKAAKSDGFDLPALRLVISERRKRAKDSAAYETLTGIAEAYRNELERGTDRALTRARTKAATPKHDPETGEITPSPAGGVSSAGPSQAVEPRSPGPIPAGVPKPDDGDEGWQARDGHDSYVLALQVANGKVPHPADASHIVPSQPTGTAIDDNPMPAHLRFGSAARAAAIAAGGGE